MRGGTIFMLVNDNSENQNKRSIKIKSRIKIMSIFGAMLLLILVLLTLLLQKSVYISELKQNWSQALYYLDSAMEDSKLLVDENKELEDEKEALEVEKDLLFLKSLISASSENEGYINLLKENNILLEEKKILTEEKRVLAEENEELQLSLDETASKIYEVLSQGDKLRTMRNEVTNMFASSLEMLNLHKLPLWASEPEKTSGDSFGGTEELEDLKLDLTNVAEDMAVFTVLAGVIDDFLNSIPKGYPCDNRVISSKFGYRINPFYNAEEAKNTDNELINSYTDEFSTSIVQPDEPTIPIEEIEFHSGIDIPMNLEDSVYATADGIVRLAKDNKDGYGNLVIIDHAYGYSTYYAHNSKLLVKEGDKVERGNVIALSGSTGRSKGVHTHYEVRLNEKACNPMPYLS